MKSLLCFLVLLQWTCNLSTRKAKPLLNVPVLPVVRFNDSLDTLQSIADCTRLKLPSSVDSLLKIDSFQAYYRLIELVYQQWNYALNPARVDVKSSGRFELKNYGTVESIQVTIKQWVSQVIPEQFTLLINPIRKEVIFINGHYFYMIRTHLAHPAPLFMNLYKRRGVGYYSVYGFSKDHLALFINNEQDSLPPAFLKDISCKNYANSLLTFYNQDKDGDGILDFGFQGTLLDFCGRSRTLTSEDGIIIRDRHPIDFYYLVKYDSKNQIQLLPKHTKRVYQAIQDETSLNILDSIDD